MKKKVLALLTCAILLLALTACGGGSGNSGGGAGDGGSGSGDSGSGSVKISIYQDKYEIDAALKAACEAYTALHPEVTFTVESSSSGDFYTQLKTMFASGQGPDIFSTKGSEDMRTMVEYMVDLSGESWVKDLSAATLGNLDAACEKLQAAGITPISSNYAEWYQSGMFKFSAVISRQADPMAFIQALNDGSATLAGNKEVENLAKWIDIEKTYSASPLNTDFNTEVSDFATGKCAIMLGGSWSQSSLDDIDPNLNVGMFGLPLSENAAETMIYTSCSPFWSVNKDSANAEVCKDFLNWLATSEEGRNYLGNEFKLIPGFANVSVTAEAIGALGVATQECMESGETYGIFSSFFPDGGAELFGNTINKYAALGMSVEEFGQELQADWESVR